MDGIDTHTCIRSGSRRKRTSRPRGDNKPSAKNQERQGAMGKEELEDGLLVDGAELERRESFPSKGHVLPNELELEDLQNFLMQFDSIDLPSNLFGCKGQLPDDPVVRVRFE